MKSLEERFVHIVKEMDAELVAAENQITTLKSQLRTATFPTQQATNCGKCEAYKHTPWRDDDYGYICASCLVEIKDQEINRLKEFIAEQASNPKPTADQSDSSTDH